MTSTVIPQEATTKKVYIGIDVHAKTYAVTAVKQDGSQKRWSMGADNAGLIKKLKKDYGDYEIRSVYEAGFSGFVLHRELEQAGIGNIVINPGSLAVSPKDRVKTDIKDSAKLATSLLQGSLKPIHVPSIELEQRRQLNRWRQQVVKERTRVMIQIRRRLYHFGYVVSPGAVLQKRSVEDALQRIPSNELKQCVQAQLRLWETIDKELKVVNRALKEQAQQCPFERLYRSVPGIGPVTARILANELGDLQRFKNEKGLFNFVGLTPSEYSSGEHVRRGHITRQGKAVLRKVLVEAAWVAIRNDQGLQRFYAKLAVRAGAKRAIVAVARKLIGRARALFRTGELYRVEKLQHEVMASAATTAA